LTHTVDHVEDQAGTSHGRSTFYKSSAQYRMSIGCAGILYPCHRACLWHRIVESFNGRIYHMDGYETGAPDTSARFTAAGVGVNDVLVHSGQLLAVVLQYICIIDRYCCLSCYQQASDTGRLRRRDTFIHVLVGLQKLLLVKG